MGYEKDSSEAIRGNLLLYCFIFLSFAEPRSISPRTDFAVPSARFSPALPDLAAKRFNPALPDLAAKRFSPALPDFAAKRFRRAFGTI
jgi:hypothetical protein